MARAAEKSTRKKSPRKPRLPSRANKAASRAGGKKPIDLYYWPTPNGWKITIMFEECGLAYTVIPVDISKGDQFKPPFLAISPNNRMPAIVDHDGPGGKPTSIFESGAILQYSAARPENSIPRTSAAASRSTNGCSGRSPISAQKPARQTTSATMRPSDCHTRSSASAMR